MLWHNLKLPWTLAHEENPHPSPRRRGQPNLLKGERITNAKTRIPNQRSKKKRKRRERNEKEEMKRNKWKGRNEKKERKRKRRILDRISEESKKEKAKNTQSQISHQINTIPKKKSYWSMITHVIFDLIGNNLQSQVLTYLWFGIRMKHLPVWD